MNYLTHCSESPLLKQAARSARMPALPDVIYVASERNESNSGENHFDKEIPPIIE